AAHPVLRRRGPGRQALRTLPSYGQRLECVCKGGGRPASRSRRSESLTQVVFCLSFFRAFFTCALKVVCATSNPFPASKAAIPRPTPIKHELCLSVLRPFVL